MHEASPTARARITIRDRVAYAAMSPALRRAAGVSVHVRTSAAVATVGRATVLCEPRRPGRRSRDTKSHECSCPMMGDARTRAAVCGSEIATGGAGRDRAAGPGRAEKPRRIDRCRRLVDEIAGVVHRLGDLRAAYARVARSPERARPEPYV
jgi:hypothetical protein